MKDTWSLDILYKGYDDPAFQQDLQAFDQSIEACNALAEKLDHNDEKQTLVSIINALEEFKLLSYKLFAYVNLQQSTNTTDPTTAAYIDKITKKSSNVSKANAKFNRFIANVENLTPTIFNPF